MDRNSVCSAPLNKSGTGKTTTLSKMIASTARARGSDAVIAASFTKTAAAELVSRDLPIPKRQIGTLHSLAFRSIDAPRVVDEELLEWNRLHDGYKLTIQPGSKAAAADDGAPLESFGGTTEGDVLLSKMDTYRARMIDRELWPRDVQTFARTWDAWKADNDLIDFTDMIEIALLDVPYAPGRPQVGFFDEVQDFTRLELTLIRKWGADMERIILAGDDDQCLFRFKGATPDAFLDPPVDDIDKRVLEQSYRVPRAVHAVAERYIRHLSRREQKTYLARDEEGEVAHCPAYYSAPENFADAIEGRLEAGDGSVMVLAACGYMLDPVKHELRKRGIPFHNPYRRTRGDWNPMRPAPRGQVASKDRLLAYLIIDERIFGADTPWWSTIDVQRWMHVIKTQGLLVKGGKDLINAWPTHDRSGEPVPVAQKMLMDVFASEDELERAVTPDLRWFEEHLLAAARKPMEFPLAVARRDAKLLREEPKVVLGTIHSVKGGQADTVFLIPDLSVAGANEWAVPGEPRDSVIRQFYVGMTRARERLFICESATTRSLDPGALLRGVA